MNMKKYIKSLLMLVLAAMALTGCREEVGTDPGNDGTPIATVYQYTAGAGYNSDNDCLFRVATNAAVGEVYYLAELKTEKEARNMTADAYAEYVVAHGTKVDVKASDYKDVYVTNLHGLYAVTVVAVKGGTKTSQSIEFAGLDYKPYGTGVYHSDMFGDLGTVNVEYSEVGSRYRIKDVWGVDHGFAFSINGTKVTVDLLKLKKMGSIILKTHKDIMPSPNTTVFIRYGFNLISQGSLDMYKNYVDMNDLPNYLNSGYWIYKRNIHNL